MSNNQAAVEDLIDELYDVLEKGWSLPLSGGKSFIDTEEARQILDEIREAIPAEVRKAKVPALLIHGSRDTFVPCSMCEEIYRNYAGPKRKLIVSGAGHAESYYKDPEAYEAALDEFTGGIIK